MGNILSSIFNKVFPSIIVTGLLAFFLPLIALFDGINKRYISHNLIPYDVGQGDIGQLLFLYIDKDIVDTGFTVAFWIIVACVVIFGIWVLINTYNEISNILIIDAEYSNKQEHYLISVLKLAIAKSLVSLSGVVVILLSIKYLIPGLLQLIGKNLLAETLTIQNILLIFIWWFVLTIVMEAIWLVATYMFRFIKS